MVGLFYSKKEYYMSKSMESMDYLQHSGFESKNIEGKIAPNDTCDSPFSITIACQQLVSPSCKLQRFPWMNSVSPIAVCICHRRDVINNESSIGQFYFLSQHEEWSVSAELNVELIISLYFHAQLKPNATCDYSFVAFVTYPSSFSY